MRRGTEFDNDGDDDVLMAGKPFYLFRDYFRDIHTTILHQLGMNHEKLTYRFGGRDMRLTDVHGHVITPLLA